MKKVLSSIWFLSLVICIPVILFLPPVFDKYNLAKECTYFMSNGLNSYLYFSDLDSDGNMERIETFVQDNPAKTFSFLFFDHNGGMVDQINWPGEFTILFNRLYFADADRDGNQEVYSFSIVNDSLYLRWLQLCPEITPIRYLPVCPVYKYRDSLYSYSIGPIHCVDLEHDGRNELIFAVTAGFSITPRMIVKVDVPAQKVTYSQITGCANSMIHFFDVNGDGTEEIIAEGEVSPIRKNVDLPCNEPAPFLKVLDANLNNLFPPVKFFEGIQSITRTFPVVRDTNCFLCSVFLSYSSECPPVRPYLIDLSGNKVDSLVIDNTVSNRYKMVFQNDQGNLVAQVAPGEFVVFSPELNYLKRFVLQDQDLNLILETDLNEDGKKEYFFSDRSFHSIYLYTDHLKRHYTLKEEGDAGFSQAPFKISKNRFCLGRNKHFEVYRFTRNPFYWLKFPAYLVVYLAGVFFFYILQKTTEARLRKQYELKDQVRELQMKSFRNQLDPHFIFNTFNAIASVIKKGDQDTAYKTFMQFSRLIRRSLIDFSSDFISLGDEIQTVRDFLELQKIRFRDVFDYTIQVEDDYLLTQPIPRMMIQVHAENAVKHGLVPRKEGGRLTVQVYRDDQQMMIEILDNGVGREMAKLLKTGTTGIGTTVMSQFIDYINKQNNLKISQQVIDLYERDGKAMGTKVQLSVPIKDR